MSNTKVKLDTGGLFGILLTILFIALKLCGVIDWSWVWVLCPIWIGIAFGLVALVLFLLVMGCGALVALAITRKL